MAEETKEKEEQDKKSNLSKLSSRKEKILLWFKNPSNLSLFAILLLAFAIRLFFFFMTKNQAVWWDEAEYMVQAKRIAFGFKWDWTWSPRKPILMSFVFGMLYKIGFNEAIFKFMIMLCSFFTVYLTYLVVKDFFDKKIGLLAAFFMSIWWVPLFFVARFETLVPSTMFLLLATHFFYRGCVKKQGSRYIWLFGVFFALVFLVRVTIGIMLIPFLIYFIMEEKWRFLINKNLWIALVLAIIVVSPFFIWLSHVYPDDPIGKFIGLKYGRFAPQEHGSMGLKGLPVYFKDIPNLLKTPFFLLFLFSSIIFLADLLLGFDLLFKKEYQHLRLKVMIIIWILFPMLVWGITTQYAEQRHALTYAVFIFSIMAVGTLQLYKWISKYNKIIAALLVVVILALGTQQQFVYGYELTKAKVDSYMPVKEAALWMKENSQPDDVIFTMSVVQNIYYSERDSYGLGWAGGEDEFEQKLEEKRPKYLVISIFEPDYLTPAWSYSWPERHQELTIPMKAWFADAEQKQPILIIYLLNWSNFKGFNYTASSNSSLSS